MGSAAIRIGQDMACSEAAICASGGSRRTSTTRGSADSRSKRVGSIRHIWNHWLSPNIGNVPGIQSS